MESLDKPFPELFANQNITLGCDPEFFIRKNGEIVGSEQLIPKEGITAYGGTGLTVIDGVQAELHPTPAMCREVLIRNIRACLISVRDAMAPKKMIADFSQMVEVSKVELDRMEEENKKFGCSASMNVHKKGKNKTSKINVDPLIYLKRSAGGHVHIGAQKGVGWVNPDTRKYEMRENPTFTLLKDYTTLIPVLDILVGNTCVLLDRDESNVERRKNYGRAGEYRLPSYGIEYRTLSNFWLAGSPLASLVFGLARMAVNLCEQSTEEHDYRTKLMSLVNMKDIQSAINNNDFDLARKNFDAIKDFLMSIIPNDDRGFYALQPNTIASFEKLVKKGVKHYFKMDPMEAWLNPPTGYSDGFYSMHTNVLSNVYAD